MEASVHNLPKQRDCDSFPSLLRTMQIADLQYFLLPKYPAVSLQRDLLSMHSRTGEKGIKERENKAF